MRALRSLGSIQVYMSPISWEGVLCRCAAAGPQAPSLPLVCRRSALVSVPAEKKVSTAQGRMIGL